MIQLSRWKIFTIVIAAVLAIVLPNTNGPTTGGS